MAIAGLSVFEPRLSRESQPDVSRRLHEESRPNRRASSILQMWRELEDDNLVSQSSPGRERSIQNRIDALSGLSSYESHGDDTSTVETEEKYYSASPAESENFLDDASDLGETERERVRQVFQEWKTNSTRELTSDLRGRSNGGRGEWLDEMEQERVRVIREWVHLSTSHRDQRQDRASESAGRIEQVLDGLVINSNGGQNQQARRGIRRLCGRQILLDMIKKSQRERKMEIQELLEHRVVSHFSHRLRIQSILRGRFLRNDRVIDERRNVSRTYGDLGLLTRRHNVTNLREGFISNLENSNGGQRSYQDSQSTPDLQNDFNSDGSDISCDSDTNTTDQIRQETDVQTVESIMNRGMILSRECPPNSATSGAFQSHFFTNEDDPLQDPVLFQERFQNDDEIMENTELPDFVVDLQSNNFNHDQNNDQNEAEEDEDRIADLMESQNRDHVLDVWNDDVSSQAVDRTVEQPDQAFVQLRTLDSLYLDSDTTHGSELQELMNRRSVSTLLRSGFRRNLDQLMQSFAERQNDYLEESLEANPELVENDVQLREQTQNTPHLPSNSEQIWEQETRDYNSEQSEAQLPNGIEWDIINDMRVDMARLQQRMNNMQRMLETCMNMQLELQRSIKQEVSSALKRPASSSGSSANDFPEEESKWDDVRKGLCCVCRTSTIDSLLYRCGHLCTCVECANDLLQNMGNCPMCWAPVAEVIRAYFL